MSETTTNFRHLFTPIDVGPVKLRNRIYVTPHATNFASEGDNLPGERLAYYCAERAKGGAALVEVSMGIVSAGDDSSSVLSATKESHFSHMHGGNPMTLTGRWPINASDPRVVEGYSRLAKMVHEYGSRSAIELSVGGTNVGSEEGVSAYPYPSSNNIFAMPGFTPRELNVESIDGIVEAFGKAAKYVRDSGLDGVDIHASHGALISEFLSPLMNQRKDGYGGSIQNRMRLLEEVIKRTREYVADSVMVGMRVSAEPFVGGNGPDEVAEICRRLDGKLDWVTTDRGYYPQDDDWQAVPMYVESGYNLKITSPVKAAVKKTRVGVVGRYIDPYFAERLLSDGQADMVAMTRALIADPEIPNKAREGRVEDIRPCIGAMQDCWGRMNRGLPISCTVNPSVSREKEWGLGTIKKAGIKKKVLVIGGGPAGLETARVAAERGHDVTLYEKGRTLGGQVNLAGMLPGRVDVKSIVTWQEAQLKKLGVEVKYGMEVTDDPEVVKYILDEETPDVVVIATGATPLRNGYQPYTFHEVEGWNQPGVCSEVDVLEKKVEIGQSVIVADTLGFIEAPGVGELLARQGKNVEIITFHPAIGLEVRLLNHYDHLFPRLYSAGVKITPSTWIKRIEGSRVTLYNVFYKKSERIVDGVDNVVFATGKIQNDSLYNVFKDRVKEVHLVGDSRIAGAKIGNAIYDGQRVARGI